MKIILITILLIFIIYKYLALQAKNKEKDKRTTFYTINGFNFLPHVVPNGEYFNEIKYKFFCSILEDELDKLSLISDTSLKDLRRQVNEIALSISEKQLWEFKQAGSHIEDYCFKLHAFPRNFHEIPAQCNNIFDFFIAEGLIDEIDYDLYLKVLMEFITINEKYVKLFSDEEKNNTLKIISFTEAITSQIPEELRHQDYLLLMNYNYEDRTKKAIAKSYYEYKTMYNDTVDPLYIREINGLNGIEKKKKMQDIVFRMALDIKTGNLHLFDVSNYLLERLENDTVPRFSYNPSQDYFLLFYSTIISNQNLITSLSKETLPSENVLGKLKGFYKLLTSQKE